MPGNYAEFGPEASGARLAELDHSADISNSMKNLMMFSQIAENDAHAPLYKAEARKYGAEADILEQNAAAQKDMAALMAGRAASGGGGGSGGSGNIAYDAADFYARRGMVDMASKLVLRGAQTESAQATRDWRNAEVATQGLVQQRNQFSLIGSLAGQVKDQASLDRMLATAQAMHLPIEGIPTDYEAVKGQLPELVNRSMTAVQSINAAISQQRQATAERAAAATTRARDAQVRASDARVKLLDERYAAAVKYGGERSAEAQALKQEKITTERQKRALEQARNPGATPQVPLSLPTVADNISNLGTRGDLDAAKLQIGKYYANKAGHVLQWNGKGFVEPPREAMGAGPAGEGVDDEEDDDE